MDKQKEIEKMAFSVCKVQNEYESITSCEKCGYTGICRNQEYAEEFIKKGYGDVRYVVKEFAERLKEKFIGYVAAYIGEEDNGRYHSISLTIDRLIKEMYGDEVSKNDKA